MLKYVGKRILYMIGVFFVVSIILFVLFNNVPGDRALNQVQNLRGKVSDETFQLRYQEAREKLGLDDPIPVRYVKWMGNLLKGDLGYSSFYKKDVKDCLSTPLLNTIQINIVSTILALAITIPLGIHCAVRKFSKFDNTVQVLTIVGYSMPQYIVALVFIFVFAVKLGWFPISGMNTPNFQGTRVAFVLDRLHYLALPVIVMTVAALGSMTRYVRAAMIDALRMDYIRTARAKGVHRLKVIFKHALKNALIPVVTYVGPMVAYILTGSMVVENIFTIGGLGTEFVTSIVNRDYTMIMAITIFLAVLMVVANLLTDIAYKLIDPRITFE